MEKTTKVIISLVAGALALIVGGVVALILLVVVVAGGPTGSVDDEGSTSSAQCAPSTTAASDDDNAEEDGDEDSLEEVPEEHQDAVDAAAEESGISATVLASQIDQESGWDPEAESPVGAQGIAQFMPDTWETYGEGGDPLDPEDAIPAMGRFMGTLWEEVEPHADGDERTQVELTLAAYNAGPGAVDQYEGIPPFDETENYVETILDVGQGSYTTDCTPVGGQEVGELGTGEWTEPLPGGTVTSKFGSRSCPIPDAINCSGGVSDHRGIDFGSPPPHGEIVAPMDLEIRATGVIDGWEQLGWVVLAKMPEDPGLHVEFAHCVADSIQVEPGDTVAPGTHLCDEGTTGASNDPHLHLQFGTPEDGDEEVPGWENLIDPEPLLREKGVL